MEAGRSQEVVSGWWTEPWNLSQLSLTLLFGSLTTFLASILVLEAPLQFCTTAVAGLQLDRALPRTIMTNCRACITTLQFRGIVIFVLTVMQS